MGSLDPDKSGLWEGLPRLQAGEVAMGLGRREQAPRGPRVWASRVDGAAFLQQDW